MNGDESFSLGFSIEGIHTQNKASLTDAINCFFSAMQNHKPTTFKGELKVGDSLALYKT